MHTLFRSVILISSFIGLFPTAQAESIFQSAHDFVSESFAGKPPEAEVLWLQADFKKRLEDILDHSYEGKRIRYWQQGSRSVWVLDETAKPDPSPPA